MSRPARGWTLDVTRESRTAFAAVLAGWTLSGFDFAIITFVLLDIQQSFTVDRALAGALGTVTLLCRLAGGLGAGLLADRRGRKTPLILSVLWFALFAGLSGFSTSYAMLFALRALFGIGLGGVWAAGIPLALEHWPARSRGLASGVLQGGWFWGYLLAALAFHTVYPLVGGLADPLSDAAGASLGWRVLLWIGAAPAVVAFWIRSGVRESPVWLDRQRRLAVEPDAVPDHADRAGLRRLLRPDLRWTALHTSLLMGAFMCSYYALSFWYPTFLREAGRDPLGYLLAFNLGAIAGMALWGRASETRLGRRGAVAAAALIGVAAIPAYLGTSGAALASGAVVMGASGGGVWGMAPAYLTERFPTAVRGVGPGLAYHAGAALGAVTPLVLGRLQDGGMTTGSAMAACIGAAGLLVAAIIWLGPETRGRRFAASEA